MIPRYSRPDMVAIWSPETKFRIWFEIEAHAADAMAALGIIPHEAAEKVWERGGPAVFDIERIDAIEREVEDVRAGRTGRFSGTARFAPAAGGLAYREAGTLTFSGSR